MIVELICGWCQKGIKYERAPGDKQAWHVGCWEKRVEELTSRSREGKRRGDK